MTQHTLDLPCRDTASAENAVQWCRRRDLPAKQEGTAVRVALEDLSGAEASRVVTTLTTRYGKEHL